MPRYKVIYKRRFRRQIAAQEAQLGGKAVADGIAAFAFRGIANSYCRRPYPDYVGWQVFNDVANKKTEDFWYSLLTLGAHALVSEILQ